MRSRSETATRRAALVLAATLCGFLPKPGAASEAEHAFGLVPRYAAVFHTEAGGEDAHGVGLSFGYRYGLTDFWSLTTDATYALLPVRGGLEHLGFVRFGTTYTIDALEWVPWIGLGLGAYYLSDAKNAFDGGVSAGVGVDYRPRRTFSAGIDVWYHALFQNLGTIPATLTVGVRLVWYLE